MAPRQSRYGKSNFCYGHAASFSQLTLKPCLHNCQVAQEIKSQGGEAIALAGDVTAEGFPQRCVEATVKAFGTIDILINNAGTHARSPSDLLLSEGPRPGPPRTLTCSCVILKHVDSCRLHMGRHDPQDHIKAVGRHAGCALYCAL